MKRLFKVAALIACVLTAFPASAKVSPASLPASAPDSALELLVKGLKKIQANEGKAGLKLLEEAIHAPNFDDLPAEQRHAAYTLAASVAAEQGEWPHALEYSRKATAFDDVEGFEWHVFLSAAYHEQEWADCATALTTIARQWSNSLEEVRDEAIFRIVNKTKSLPGKDRLDLLNALYDAGWKVDGFAQPSGVWRDLALELLENGAAARAGAVLERVEDPYVAIGLRADMRFQPIIDPTSARLDISDLARKDIERFRANSASNPRSLEAVNQLSYRLFAARRFDDVLRLSEAAIAKAKSADRPYEDIADQLVWTMDQRSRALRAQGRWDEAVDQLRDAARRPERGDINVSHAINLGDLYNTVGRPRDALAAVADLGQASPYGLMQAEGVRAEATLQLKDAASLERSISFIRAHAADAPMSAIELLIITGHGDEAAERLIARLADSKERNQTLVDLQDYPPRPFETARMADRRRHWTAFMARPDVQAAVKKVGRIDRYDLDSPPG